MADAVVDEGKEPAAADEEEGDNATDNYSTATIQLDAMSLEQLDQLKQREEQRLHAFAQRFAALRQAAARLQASASAVAALTMPEQEDEEHEDEDIPLEPGGSETKSSNENKNNSRHRDVFVPLTESVYVPGKLLPVDDGCSPPPLLVELGTGYFVEKDAAGTLDFLRRRGELVDANSENGASSVAVSLLLLLLFVVVVVFQRAAAAAAPIRRCLFFFVLMPRRRWRRGLTCARPIDRSSRSFI